MTTRDELVWLFRCILGRDPETESTIDGMVARFPDFLAARHDILNSSELRTKQRRDNPALARNHALSSADFARFVDSQLGAGLAEANSAHVSFDAIAEQRGSIPKAVFAQISKRLNAKLVLLFGELADHAWLLNLLARRDGTDCSIVIVSIPDSARPQTTVQESYSATCNFQIGNKHIFHIRAPLAWNIVFPIFSIIGIEPELVVISMAVAQHVRIIAEESYNAIHNSGLVMIRCDSGEIESIKDSVRTLLSKVFHRDEIIAGPFFLVQKWEWYVPFARTGGAIWARPNDSSPIPDPMLPEKLGLACIVKNEEKFVQTMLNSCVPICSFFIIVDTGSNDSTLDIVRDTLSSAGRPFQIIQIEFTDFAAARNVAIDHMPSWIDWVLMMDADEHLVIEDFDKFSGLMNGGSDAWMLPRYNFFDAAKSHEPGPYPDRQRRLFRNYADRRVRYFGAVHEGLVGVRDWGVAQSNLAAIGMGEGGPHIHHMGRVGRTDDEKKKKTELYTRLANVVPTRS